MFGSGADFYSLRSPLGFGLKTQTGCKGFDIKSRSLTSALLEGLCLRNCLPHSSLSLCSVFVSLSLPAFFTHFSPLFFFSLLCLLFSSLEMFPLKGFGRAPFWVSCHFSSLCQRESLKNFIKSFSNIPHPPLPPTQKSTHSTFHTSQRVPQSTGSTEPRRPALDQCPFFSHDSVDKECYLPFQ